MLVCGFVLTRSNLPGDISMSETNLIWNKLAAHLAGASDKQSEPHEVRREPTLQDDLGLSSLMVINLILELEHKFGITIREEDFKNVATAGDIKDLIDAKLGREQ
jgi:acyl carrier protein